MDKVSKEIRSKIMASVNRQGTGPERELRKLLHARGFRFRVNRRDLPGSPDIVLTKYKAVIFVHGCFWHRHDCKLSTTPSSNREFWESKFEANKARDRKNIEELQKLGWRVKIVWQCELKKSPRVMIVDSVECWLKCITRSSLKK